MNSAVILNLNNTNINRTMKVTNAGIVMSFLGFIGGIVIGYLDGQITLGIIAGSLFGILICIWNSEG